MDLQQYLQALRKYWPVIVAGLVLGGMYGGYSVSGAESRHRASVTFFVVTTTSDESASAAVQGDQFAQRRVNSYVALLRTERLAERLVERTDLELTPGQVRNMMGASGDLDTVLLTATVTHAERSVVDEIGDLVATEFVALVDEIENGDAGSSSVQLEVVSGPSVRELEPRVPLLVGVPAFWGLVLGLAGAIALELRDTTVRSEDQARELAGAPIIGSIPDDRRAAVAPVLIGSESSSPFGESFRQLRTSLQFLDVEKPVRVLAVTSSIAEEGKSATSANLAVSLAAAGYDTLLVEADLRRPGLADLFGISRHVGLTDLLIGRADERAAIAPTDIEHLYLLPSGALPPNPSELLGSLAMRDLLDSFRARFDLLVLDTPPLLPVSDAAVLSVHADAVMMTVREGHVTRNQLAQGVASLRRVGATLLGLVTTWSTASRDGYGSYGRRPDVSVTSERTDLQPSSRTRIPTRHPDPGPSPHVDGDSGSGSGGESDSDRGDGALPERSPPSVPARRLSHPPPGSVTVGVPLPDDERPVIDPYGDGEWADDWYDP